MANRVYRVQRGLVMPDCRVEECQGQVDAAWEFAHRLHRRHAQHLHLLFAAVHTAHLQLQVLGEELESRVLTLGYLMGRLVIPDRRVLVSMHRVHRGDLSVSGDREQPDRLVPVNTALPDTVLQGHKVLKDRVAHWVFGMHRGLVMPDSGVLLDTALPDTVLQGHKVLKDRVARVIWDRRVQVDSLEWVIQVHGGVDINPDEGVEVNHRNSDL